MAFARSLFRIPKAYPFAFGAIFSAVKTGGADVLVQKVEGAGDVDWRRVSIFSTFGLLFCGFWQYALFTKFMPRLCPNAVSFAAKSWRAKLADRQGLKELGIQVFLENGINNPLLYFPVFYSVKIGLETESYNPLELFPKGIDRCVIYIFVEWCCVLSLTMYVHLIMCTVRH